MAEETTGDKGEATAAKKPKDTGFFGSMSGTQKLILIVFALAIFGLVWYLVFGGITNIYQATAFLVSFIAIMGLFYMIAFFVQFYLSPDFFSPKKDYFNRLCSLAIDLKPGNLRDLYFRGDKDKKRVKAGNIVGCLGIPYLIGHIKTYENNVFDESGKKIHSKGEMMYEISKALGNRKIPVFSKIEYGEDGDTFFIYEAGWFLFKKRHFVRCHKALHGDLNGDVEIYDINPVPYGNLFEYPFKQLQRDPAKIMLQSQMEVILATHDHQTDLISQGVDSAVHFNPYFRLLHKQASEMSAE